VESDGNKPLNLRQRSKLETRARLLNAGYELFLERGFLAPTIAEITAGAQVSPGAFYTHFKDKEDMLGCIWQGVQGELSTVVPVIVARHADNTPGAIETRARIVVETVLSFIEVHGNAFAFWFSTDVAATRVGQSIIEQLAASFEERTRTEIDLGIVDPQMNPSVCALAATGMWPPVLRWWLKNRDQVPREQVVETMLRYHLAIFK
jgi:AcrR family transcriptional regulator